VLLFKRASTDGDEFDLIPLERQSLDLLDIEASIDAVASQSPLRRKSLSTRHSLSLAAVGEDREADDADGGGQRDQPKRPLKQTGRGREASDVIGEAVAEAVELVDVDLLRSRSRPEAAPEGFDLASERKAQGRKKRRLESKEN
jgi:hypothetical protein